MEAYANAFFGFRGASNLTDVGLANKLLAALTTAGVPVIYMVGQGYDRGATMSDCKNGVQKHIRDKYPHSNVLALHFTLFKFMLNESRPGNRDQKISLTNERNCHFLSRFKQENKKSPRCNPTEMHGVSQNPSETAL